MNFSLCFRVIENNGGSPPLTYMLFNQVTKAMGDPPRPVDDPDFTGVNMVVSDDHDNKYGIPSLEKMGRFFDLNFKAINFCGH